jgi:hypothetical protein
MDIYAQKLLTILNYLNLNDYNLVGSDISDNIKHIIFYPHIINK